VAENHLIILNRLAGLPGQKPEFEVPACRGDVREVIEMLRREQRGRHPGQPPARDERPAGRPSTNVAVHVGFELTGRLFFILSTPQICHPTPTGQNGQERRKIGDMSSPNGWRVRCTTTGKEA
jgi:hypothetical protein